MTSVCQLIEIWGADSCLTWLSGLANDIYLTKSCLTLTYIWSDKSCYFIDPMNKELTTGTSVYSSGWIIFKITCLGFFDRLVILCKRDSCCYAVKVLS